MECISPLSLPRPNGLGSIDRVTVPCGKCVSCIQKKRNQWSFRLEQELKSSDTAYFVTMTYDDKNTTGLVCKKDVQDFLKRLRIEVDRKVCNVNINGLKPFKRPKIRYYITAEYGTQTKRPHYHGIFFNIPLETEQATNLILKTWQHGFVYIGKVSPASIAYVTKYLITKNEDYEKKYEVFNLISLGLGRSYVDKNKTYHRKTKNYYATQLGGKKIALPRYYRDKIFTKLETQIHNKSELKKSDLRYMDEIERISKLSHSIGVYKNTQIQQLEENLKNKISKNSKL